MALIHDWMKVSATANRAGTAVAMQTRMGILDDIEKAARAWYDREKDRILVRKRILLWTVTIRISDCVGVLRLLFGDDFDSKVYIPGGTGPIT